MSKTNLKKLDLLLLIIFPVIATVLSHLLNLNYLSSTLLFYVIPSIYFTFRTPTKVKEVATFVLLVFIPIGIIVDYIWETTNAWVIPHSVFIFRLFGQIPIENFIWGISSTYFCLILYEHFLDKGKQKAPRSFVKRIGSVMLVLYTIFLMFLIFGWGIPTISFSYLKLGTILVALPVITFLSFFPKLLSKFVKVGIYFFGVSVLNELTALDLDYWRFPGKEYVGRILFFGYHIPLEEVFFFFLLGFVAILSYYEFFIDDQK